MSPLRMPGMSRLMPSTGQMPPTALQGFDMSSSIYEVVRSTVWNVYQDWDEGQVTLELDNFSFYAIIDSENDTASFYEGIDDESPLVVTGTENIINTLMIFEKEK